MRSNESFAEEIANGVIDFLEKRQKMDLLDKVVRILQGKLDSNKVTVLTPRLLGQAEKDKIAKLVHKLIGGNNMDIIFALDTNLLDGIRIESRDKIWDFSLFTMFL